MLTCREVAERAEDWIDHDLSAWQALQMRLHLAMCKGCDRFIGQMRVSRSLTVAADKTDADKMQEGDDARINSILSQLHKGKQTGG